MMNFFQKVYKSITDIKSYAFFADQPSKKAFAYFIILINIAALLWILPLTLQTPQFIEMVSNEVTAGFDNKVPDFTLSNGQLEVKAEMPLIVADEPESIIVVDTTGQTDRSVLDDRPQGALVTKDGAIIKQRNNRYQEVLFKDFQGEELTKATAREMMAGLLPYLKLITPVLLVGGMTVFILGSLFMLLIITVIAQIISAIQHQDLTFRKLFNVSAHAMTLPLILVLGNSFLENGIPFFRLLCFVLIMVYQWKALKVVGLGGIVSVVQAPAFQEAPPNPQPTEQTEAPEPTEPADQAEPAKPADPVPPEQSENNSKTKPEEQK